jgi:hypothetical protein
VKILATGQTERRSFRIRTDPHAQADGVGSQKARRGLEVRLLFLGLGTGLGSAMIVEGLVAPMEIAHLPYKKGTYEDYVGRTRLERAGKKKSRRHVADVVEHLITALLPDDTVIGGGNVTKLKVLPPHSGRVRMPMPSSAVFDCGQNTMLSRRICRLAAFQHTP